MARKFFGGLVEFPEDVLEVEDLLEEESKVYVANIPVRGHPEMVEAAIIEVEVH